MRASAVLTREDIAALIPHQGRMCLLDTVDHWDEHGIVCSSLSHRSGENPLRSGHRLNAVHLAEYGAQAMAVHGGLLARREGGVAAPGMLASLRDIELSIERIDDLPAALHVSAKRLVRGAGGWMYEFSVRCNDRGLGRGRLSVILNTM